MVKYYDMANENNTKTQAAHSEAITGVASNSGTSGAPLAKDIDEAMQQMKRDDIEKSVQAKAKALKLPYIDIAHMPVNEELLYLVNLEEASNSLVLVFFRIGKKIRIAVFDPENAETKKTFERLKGEGYTLDINLASREGILQAIELYKKLDTRKKENNVLTIEEQAIEAYQKEIETIANMKEKIATVSSEEALNIFNVGAIKTRASDIHFQPEEAKVTVRFRIDGVLQNVIELDRKTYENISTQIKHKSGMKLNIVDRPQDGRYSFVVNQRKIDVRVSSIPSQFGESFVCRFLDSGKHFLDIKDLGFQGEALKKLEEAVKIRNGMILVTGPTGSGKTTTLYALLTRFNKPEIKIITLENPIEYNLHNITQSQISEKSEYTFGGGLRAILRQDPDIVMIGEIRDRETAEVSAQAALTGHVLLSTLHTNSAVETIPRLINIGLEPFMVAPALHTVLAQRLVRKICKECGKLVDVMPSEKEEIEKHLKEINKLDIYGEVKVPEKIYHPGECDKCSHTGYSGQLAISEIFTVTDEFKEAILARKSVSELCKIARKQGMLTLREDAILKVAQGLTTLEEVERVTEREESDIEINVTEGVETKTLEIEQSPGAQVATEEKKLPPERA